jgi:hypothetical protein
MEQAARILFHKTFNVICIRLRIQRVEAFGQRAKTTAVVAPEDNIALSQFVDEKRERPRIRTQSIRKCSRKTSE